MMDEIAPYATTVIEVVASGNALSAGTEGMVFSEMDVMAASKLLGPIAHQEVADALVQAITALR
jgi:hypothetical protein